MSVWFAIPSKRPPEECEPILKLWAERGYKIALWRDEEDWRAFVDYELCVGSAQDYPGYAPAVNHLAKLILRSDPQAEWIVTGGDDVEPDSNHSAEEIARECSRHFLQHAQTSFEDTFGVMQPTGDRWGENAVPGLQGAYIDRVCGSPWMGREFCRRMYQGNGPLWPEFTHMFEDEHLQCVAQKLGVLWQRRDLTHYHRHWGRKRGASASDCPDFLRNVNTSAHWAESKAIFERLKAGGFVEAENLLP